MIESNDAKKVVETIADNLISIANNKQNFARLLELEGEQQIKSCVCSNRSYENIVVAVLEYPNKRFGKWIDDGAMTLDYSSHTHHHSNEKHAFLLQT